MPTQENTSKLIRWLIVHYLFVIDSSVYIFVYRLSKSLNSFWSCIVYLLFLLFNTHARTLQIRLEPTTMPNLSSIDKFTIMSSPLVAYISSIHYIYTFIQHPHHIHLILFFHNLNISVLSSPIFSSMSSAIFLLMSSWYEQLHYYYTLFNLFNF